MGFSGFNRYCLVGGSVFFPGLTKVLQGESYAATFFRMAARVCGGGWQCRAVFFRDVFLWESSLSMV